MKQYYIFIAFLIFGCDKPAIFNLPSSYHRLATIETLDDNILLRNQFGELIEVKNDSLILFQKDSIVDVRNCTDGRYILKALNDSTLEITFPNNVINKIENRTDINSKYFHIRLNEHCDVLLEAGAIFFQIQNNKYIDFEHAYGFNYQPSAADKTGFFNDKIFVAQVPDPIRKSFYIQSLDSAEINPLFNDIKVRDFEVYKKQLWLATGHYLILDGKEYLESGLVVLEEGNIQATEIPNDTDVACVSVSEDQIFILSEKYGFFKIRNNKLENIVSINLKESHIIPQDFIVKGNQIILATFDNGLLIITFNEQEFKIQQIT